MTLIEPLFFKNILIYLYGFISSSSYLTIVFTFLSDIFVFIYPVLLIIIYIYGIVKKNILYKKGALYILFSTVLSVFINILIQFFVHRQRPIYFLGFEKEIINKSILHNYLPSSSFPSDHATVSFSIASSILIWSLYTKNIFLKRLSYLFYIFSIIMSFSRVVIALHWITDILVGFIIGFIGSIIVFVLQKYTNKIYNIFISMEEFFLSFLLKK